MIEYTEFEHLKRVEDPKNPFSALFYYETGESFYIEGGFLTQLHGFKDQHADKYQLILNRMEELVKKNKHIVFTANYESPQTSIEGYIYLEITDVTDPLLIFAEDKSRGSDYGD